MRQIVSPLSGLISPLGQLRATTSLYAVNDFDPSLVFDFEQSYYRTGGTDSTLSNSITHAATSNATMTGSDGNIKWRPHNLQTYSNDFSNGAWSTVFWVKSQDVDGNWSFTSNAASRTINFTATTSVGNSHTVGIEAKAGTLDWVAIRSLNFASDDYHWFDLTNGAVGAGGTYPQTITDLGDGWYLCEIEIDTSVDNEGSPRIYGGSADETTAAGQFYLRNGRYYRSDLGGMVNNSATGNSYVPTTSSAVYLPRVGHHIYNGDAWANEGVLHESEARTNLVTYSNDFTDASWLKTRAVISANNTTSPSGATDATLIIPQSGGWAGVTFPSISITSGTTYTGSIYAKAGEYSWLQIGGSSPRFAATFANVNLSNGSLGNSNIGVIVTPVGNGWYRITLTAVASQSTTGNPFFVAVYDTDVSSRLPDSPNDGTSGIYLYGTQFEQGSTPSSYIPTSGSTVTRAAETLTVPSANLPYSSTNMSIQMDGRMTYADDDSISTNPRFFQWRIDTSGGIDASNSTLTSRNSWVGFRQYAGGVVDDVSTNANVYSSGINVPFNIASRHGSTFINGAIDGTALTANTTPIALPDLSATDLKLGYYFMGTIGKFRVWSDDLTDTGIATASAPSTEPSLQLTFDGSSTSSFTVLDWSE